MIIFPNKNRTFIRVLCLLLSCSATAFAQQKGSNAGNLPLGDLSGFKPTGGNWRVVGDVNADMNQNNILKTAKGTGILANLPDARNQTNIFTAFEHGDADVELDFMMAKGSNSGIYLQSRYEVQLLDSWGKKSPNSGDCGGIYERYDDAKPEGRKGYEGIPPRTNACLAPGLWQHLEISFQAPKFNAAGSKIANAKMLKVKLNGMLIHENVEVAGPTRAAAFNDEKPTAPLMIQGDHGPVAFRNIRYRSYGSGVPNLSGLRFAYFQGDYNRDTLQANPVFKAGKTGATADLTSKACPAPDDFILRYTGNVNVETAGKYTFTMQAGGKNLLKINSRTALPFEWSNTPDKRTATVDLPAGASAFEIVIAKAEAWMKPGLGLFIESPETRRTPLHSLGSLPLDEPVNPIMVAVGGEPQILRCFMDVRKPGRPAKRLTHAVSVGTTDGAHFTMNLDNGAWVQCWRGGFLDATPMWHDRGDGHAEPLGSVLTLSDAPDLAVLPDKNAPWPDSLTAAANYQFRSYDLDAAGLPVFNYTIFGLDVQDVTRPGDNGKRLTRSLKISGAAPNLYCRLAEGKDIVPQPDGSYLVDDKSYLIRITDAAGAKPVVRTVANDRQELLLPLTNRAAYSVVW